MQAGASVVAGLGLAALLISSTAFIGWRSEHTTGMAASALARRALNATDHAKVPAAQKRPLPNRPHQKHEERKVRREVGRKEGEVPHAQPVPSEAQSSSSEGSWPYPAPNCSALTRAPGTLATSSRSVAQRTPFVLSNCSCRHDWKEADLGNKSRVARWHGTEVGLTLGPVKRTFDFLRQGGSLARYGDGEWAGLHGRYGNHEKPRHVSTKEWAINHTRFVRMMRETAALGFGHDFCVGIVSSNLSEYPSTPRDSRKVFTTHYRAGSMIRASAWLQSCEHCHASVSRLDHWTSELLPYSSYIRLWQRVFANKHVVYYRGGLELDSDGNVNATSTSNKLVSRGLMGQMFAHAASFSWGPLALPGSGAFIEYDRILQDVEDLITHRKPQTTTVIFSLGVTATILAADLNCRFSNVGFIDVGNWLDPSAVTNVTRV